MLYSLSSLWVTQGTVTAITLLRKGNHMLCDSFSNQAFMLVCKMSSNSLVEPDRDYASHNVRVMVSSDHSFITAD